MRNGYPPVNAKFAVLKLYRNAFNGYYRDNDTCTMVKSVTEYVRYIVNRYNSYIFGGDKY